jgi:hypothetical protein
MAFNLRYVHMLLLRMVADVMQVMNNIKCGIYCFYICPKFNSWLPMSLRQIRSFFCQTTLCCYLQSFHSINKYHCADCRLVWGSDDGKWRTAVVGRNNANCSCMCVCVGVCLNVWVYVYVCECVCVCVGTVKCVFIYKTQKVQMSL